MSAQMDVELEDQQRINTFSRLNTRSHELMAQLAAKKAAVEDLEEAEGEVMLLDDDEVPYVVGECFVRLPREEAEERLQTALQAAQEEVAEVEAQLQGVRQQMQQLKTVLYAKFGSSINLEE